MAIDGLGRRFGAVEARLVCEVMHRGGANRVAWTLLLERDASTERSVPVWRVRDMCAKRPSCLLGEFAARGLTTCEEAHDGETVERASEGGAEVAHAEWEQGVGKW